MARTLVLLGDSIFDNGVYVEPGQADVTAHLHAKLDPDHWRIDFRAVDGAIVSHVEYQLNERPVEAPCTFVLSVGGNDALGHIELLEDPSSQTVASSLLVFATIKENFRGRYAGALDAILENAQSLIVCTIYNPVFPDPTMQRAAESALSFFNDVITEEALRRRLPIIDLRDVCSDPMAFANPIEPSEYGGDLITDAVIKHIQP